MPGREKCPEASTTVVNVYRVNPLTGPDTANPVFSKLVTFDVSDEEIKYDLYVEKLLPGTTYIVEVKANFNNSESLEAQEILHTDESKRMITTKSLSSFKVAWASYQGTVDYVVNSGLRLIDVENSGTLSPEESLKSIDRIILRMYEGKNNGDLDTKSPIGTKTIRSSEVVEFKAQFYDEIYGITSLDTFGLTMQMLKDISGNDKLNEYYTLSIEAYTANNYKINLVENVYSYRVSSILLMEDIAEPVIEIDGITNKNSGGIFNNLTNNGTFVGYNVAAAFDREQLILNNIIPKKINYYVYNSNKEKIKFYILDENGELKLVDKVTGDLGENGFHETKIYMDYGTSYETVDDIMRRGNSFYIGYEIETLADGDTLLYPVTGDENSPSDYGVYELVTADKESPNIKMFIATSDASSITYQYQIKDPDNAIYKTPDSENYSFYYIVGAGSEKEYNLDKVEDSYNRFEGRITINNLKKGDLYKLYYKKNSNKTGVFEEDVKDYFDGYGTGLSLFDGYYDAASNMNAYNFRYRIINNAEKDNKVVIRILANDEILSRIVSYKILFKDSKGNTLNKELWKLSLCDGDKEGTAPRCLSVDYTELKDAGMKSDNNETNTITVSVTALYDNGLTGYDYKVGSGTDDDFLYCILQDNSTDAGLGNYIVFSSSGQQVTVWSDTLGAPKGYYTYTLNGSLLFYKSQLNVNHRLNISVNLSSFGYSSKNGYLNPKMISIDEMECSSLTDTCNTFSFNSITPKVAVTEKAPIINGSVLNFALSGVDLNDIKLEDDGNYYLYVETWEKLEDVDDFDRVARPAVKVKIDKSNPTGTVSGLMDGLKENTTYHYNVYAYMNKNNRFVKTQLFDSAISDRYDVTTYEFKSARASDLFHSLDVTYSASEKIYGNRDLNTKINLLAYKNSISFNFDIIYVLCEVGTTNCGPDDENTKIFKKVVPLEKITSTMISDVVDISEYDLEFDKNYYMYVYASADYYNNSNSSDVVKRNVVLNRYNINIKLKKLTEPSFSVTRNASSENGDYYIDFNVVVNDPDRTLIDGNYYVKLVDGAGNLVGNMQLRDEEGIYYDVTNYNEYTFDAFVVSKNIRIRGLEPDSKYVFVVYNDAYLNNYSEEIPKEQRTYEVSETYTSYTTGTYGVAFGQEVQFNLTDTSVVLTFLGGSNFENVLEVHYTAGVWGTEDYSTFSGQYVIGENNKYFEYDKKSDDWLFTISPSGMKNDTTSKYSVVVKFKIKDENTEEGYSWFTVEGTAVYKK